MSNNSMVAEELDPSIKTGVGNPLSPYTGELLSEDDEKRVDDKGHKVAHGLLWSEAKSGRWLTVALHDQETLRSQTPLVAQTDMNLNKVVYNTKGKRWTLSLTTSEVLPRLYHASVGAALELPLDLANDSIKRGYVSEWLINTCDEALKDRKLSIRKDARDHLAAALADAASQTISKVL